MGTSSLSASWCLLKKLGAKAHPIRDPAISNNPARAMGRRPKESDNGPTEKTEAPQAAWVAVANCPATATDICRSVAISAKSAATIRFAFVAPKTATKRTARNSALFTSLALACITLGSILLSPFNKGLGLDAGYRERVRIVRHPAPLV